MENREKILQAFIETPTTYKIAVSDNSMLPKSMKNKKEVTFIVKPPVLSVLAKCGIPVGKIPKELMDADKDINLEDAVKYTKEMAEAFAILAHGKTTEFPEWYIPFILNNVTARELFILFKEVALKTQSSFFLNSFQIASISNPMTMSQ